MAFGSRGRLCNTCTVSIWWHVWLPAGRSAAGACCGCQCIEANMPGNIWHIVSRRSHDVNEARCDAPQRNAVAIRAISTCTTGQYNKQAGKQGRTCEAWHTTQRRWAVVVRPNGCMRYGQLIGLPSCVAPAIAKSLAGLQTTVYSFAQTETLTTAGKLESTHRT